jgi:Sec-independent protein secretion pathway component TatC
MHIMDMKSQLLLLSIGLALAALICAVYSWHLYRQDARQWHWYISASIGGGLTYFMCLAIAHFYSLSTQLVLILGLILAALLYALTFLLYVRKGRSKKERYTVAGAGIAALVFFAILDNFLHVEAINGFLAAFAAYSGVLAAIRLPTETH